MGAEVDFRGLFYIIRKPVNREEKRVYVKECQNIEKAFYPIITAYMELYESKEDQQEFKKFVTSKFIEKAKYVDHKHKYVKANRNFFRDFIPPITETVLTSKEKEYLKKPKIWALIITALIILIFILSLI